MRYKNITVQTNHNDADLIANAMFDAGASGVEIIDSEDCAELLKSDVVWDYVDETLLVKNEIVKVSTIIDLDGDDFFDKLKSELERLNDIGVKSGEITSKIIDEADWANEWKKYYKPIVTKSVTVVPTWIKYEAAEGERVMHLDPGMAFGTGEHATTRMCLGLLGDVAGKSVIDVGCGSGILGIAAKICGAESVYMCDIDGFAVEFAGKNAELNGVKAEIERADLIAGDRTADLIFANITADILMRLAKDIGKHINSGGSIILSGIIDSRLDEVVDCYVAAGYVVIERVAEDDWRALKLVKSYN